MPDDIWGTLAVASVFSALSSSVVYLPVVGYLISLAISLLYVFAAALRYSEITKNLKITAHE